MLNNLFIRRDVHIAETDGAGAGDGHAMPARDALDAAWTWDLSPLYADPAAWEADFARLEALTAPVLAWKGKLDSADATARLLQAETELDRLLEKLYTYAHLRHDEDTGEADGQAREARIRARYAEIAGECAWITPELLRHSTEELTAWVAEDALRPYRRTMDLVLRRKAHVLSEAEETLLAKGSEVLAAAEQTYSLLTNADMEFEPITNGDRPPLPLTEGSYRSFLENPDRAIRRRAFEQLYDGYGKLQNTLASTLSTAVKSHNYLADVHHFPSARAASLFEDQVPEHLYDSLIEATHNALPLFHRYIRLRKTALNLPDLDMYDLYLPLVPDATQTVSETEARQWIEHACAPLGDAYRAILDQAFQHRWIDWHENKGKRSGAYSSGCYDSPPYLLLNFHGRLDDAFTLAHELGHSAHTHLANTAQPHRTARYPIFLAEIASTVNELLLTHSLLDGATGNKPFRAYLLNHLCDSFKGTIYRQTMFAEFERNLHHWDMDGQPLTAEFLGEQYYDLNKTYYGPDLQADPRIAREWSRIPHFYYNFYVYKYATSFCAALIFSRRIRNRQGIEAYLDMLRAGGGADPLDLIRQAGVDLLDPGILQEAFAEFETILTQLQTELTGT